MLYFEQNIDIFEKIRFQIAEDSECCPYCGKDDLRTLQIQGGDYDENWESTYCVNCKEEFGI